MNKMKIAARVTLMMLAAIWAGCSDDTAAPATRYTGGSGNVEAEAAATADIVVTEFAVAPQANPGIYGKIDFVRKDGAKYLPDAVKQIRGYKADLTSLKASFKTNAVRVTVGDVEQTSGVTANDFSSEVVFRLWAANGKSLEFPVNLSNPADSYSGLPVVVVDVPAPLSAITKEDWVAGTVSIDRQESDNPDFGMTPAAMEIKGRGNRSWAYDKKPFTIKLDSKTKVMGMPKHKRWVLLANYMDRTLMRNKVMSHISRLTGIKGGYGSGLAWTPGGEFVELIFNGVHMGNYLLMEQIRVDANRVPVAEITNNPADDAASGANITGGYLLEIDHHYDEGYRFFSQYGNLPIMVSSPDEEVINADQKNYIKNYIDNIESIIFGASFPVTGTGGPGGGGDYKTLLDVDSFADWWIIHELIFNRETRVPGSWYVYKKQDGKLYAGPPWDFDLSTFISTTEWLLDEEVRTHQPGYFPENTNRQFRLWYNRLLKDPAFKATIKGRWAAYYTAFQSIPGYIDQQAALIERSAAINAPMWTVPDSGENKENGMTFAQAVSNIKTRYQARLTWLNNQIMAW